jgi:hypothetical protein
VATKTVVFVQGGKKHEETYPWMFFHLDPHTEPPAEPVDLVFFDYPAGKLKVWKNHLLKRGKAPVTAPDSETELTPKVKIRLVHGTTDDAGPDRASVLALYEWVKKQPKSSIRSLQVFSHGWQGGPILWGSFEFDTDGDQLNPLDGKDRDPHDTDFRMRDFVGSNPLAGAEGKKFAEAFEPDALIKLWGCVAPVGVRGQMQRFIHAPRGSRGDAARKAHLQNYLDSIGNSYPMEMAVRLDLAVWASPLGYGSEPGAKVPTNRGELKVKYRGVFPPDLKKDRWWRVSWFFRNQDRGVTFYQDVLKARIDKVDFVEHKKAWFEDAKRAATASLEPGPVDSPLGLQRRLTDRIEALGIG